MRFFSRYALLQRENLELGSLKFVWMLLFFFSFFFFGLMEPRGQFYAHAVRFSLYAFGGVVALPT